MGDPTSAPRTRTPSLVGQPPAGSVVEHLHLKHAEFCGLAASILAAMSFRGCEPEDVVQTAYVRVLERFSRDPNAVNLEKSDAWFRRVVDSTARDIIRRSSRRKRRGETRHECSQDAPWPVDLRNLRDPCALTPLELAEKKETASRIAAAILSLPAEARELIVSGAAASSSPGGGTETPEERGPRWARTYRARRKLRKLLGDLAPGR